MAAVALFCPRSRADIEPAYRLALARVPASKLASPSWVRTVQGSAAVPLESRGSAGSTLSTWLGCAIAIGSFFLLLAMHLRQRKHNRSLLRSGERDFLLLPPAGNRRRRPR